MAKNKDTLFQPKYRKVLNIDKSLTLSHELDLICMKKRLLDF